MGFDSKRPGVLQVSSYEGLYNIDLFSRVHEWNVISYHFFNQLTKAIIAGFFVLIVLVSIYHE
jgi:hypothetical protein